MNEKSKFPESPVKVDTAQSNSIIPTALLPFKFSWWHQHSEERRKKKRRINKRY